MNWGNKLLIAFVVFAGGIIYLVYRTTQTNYDLVEKDYYKKELAYQQQINGAREANNLSAQITLSQNKEGIRLQLPEEMKGRAVSGDVWFYCAYDKKMDKKFNLKTDESLTQLFSAGMIKPGNYTVKINWTDNNKTYYSEKTITVM